VDPGNVLPSPDNAIGPTKSVDVDHVVGWKKDRRWNEKMEKTA
jgi:hypothetical protein